MTPSFATARFCLHQKKVEVFFQRGIVDTLSPLIYMLSGDEIFYLDLKFISHPLSGSHPPVFAKTRVNSTHTF